MSELAPVRELSSEDYLEAKPLYAVWEVTMHCDQPCQHCGSRAGPKRDNELSTEELLEVARSLARLGCRECALIGGEAYLRKDLPELIAELAAGGIRVVMQTGGRNLPLEKIQRYREAGLVGIGVSIDGPEAIHDRLRGNEGSYAAAVRTLDLAREAGCIISANSQINRLNYAYLPETCRMLRAKGIEAWQVQLTVPMGRAADRPDWIIEPWRIPQVIDTLAALQIESLEECEEGAIPLNIVPNNNIGYFGPHEELLRSRPGGESAHWKGCLAGIAVVSVESDGTVKACPSLPTGPYAGGNVRSMTLDDLWQRSEQVRFARDRTADELWGFCKTCYFADICRAGCSWTAHCTLGRRGNNPFCYHRVEQLRKRGIRERLVAKERAPGEPYDFGRLEIVEEPWVDDESSEIAEQVPRPANRTRLKVLN